MEVAWRKGAQPSIKLPLQSRNRTAIAATEPLANIALSQFALNEPLGGGTHLQKGRRNPLGSMGNMRGSFCSQKQFPSRHSSFNNDLSWVYWRVIENDVIPFLPNEPTKSCNFAKKLCPLLFICTTIQQVHSPPQH